MPGRNGNPAPNTKGRTLTKINALTNAQLIKYMLEGIHNCKELAELTGLHYQTVLVYTRAMYRAGAAHISAWEKDSRGRDAIKIYSLGAGSDKKRQKMTKVERQAKLRAKKKALQLSLVMGGRAQYVQALNGRLRFEELPS